MQKETLIKSLQEIVGTERVITQKEAVLDAAKDYIGYRRYQRDDGKNMAPLATCVVRVENTDQAAKVLKYLNENEIDVVPRTGGSSVTRGLEPVEGGVILDGSDMNEILEINEEDMYVTAKCGTPLEYIEKTLNQKGYTAGHFPQSLPLAQVGGLLATRSIGQLSTLYGGIEDLVVGLEAVLADGSVVRIKNVPRRSAGPDLRHMFIGSEGMLGFITEATLKIFKYTPETRWMKGYVIEGMQNGLDFIHEIVKEGYRPAVIRLHDPVEVQEVLKIDAPEGMALVLLMCEGPARVTKAIGEGIEEIASHYDVQDLGSRPVEVWLETRNHVCNEMDLPTFHDMGVVIDTCEISANWSVIGKIYESVTARLPKEIPTLMLCGGHSSHSYMQGTNIYFEFGYAVTEGVEQAEREYMHVISIIMEETLKYGGSIAHHHGSGKYRTPWMPQEHGTSYPLMYKLKEALDPKGILNKGVILVDKK
jgi:alkyldihydroxyacetonephosphate synthase